MSGLKWTPLGQIWRAGEALLQGQRAGEAGPLEGQSHGPWDVGVGQPAAVVRQPCCCLVRARSSGCHLLCLARLVLQACRGYDDSQDMELEAVFNLAVSRGINLFDTADSYGAPSMTETAVPCQSQRCCRRSQYFLRLCLCTGTGALNGRSEQLLGDFVRRYPGSQRTRAGVRIATKLAPYPWRLTGGQFVAACRHALGTAHACLRAAPAGVYGCEGSCAAAGCRGSLRRLGAEQLAIGQLHWSTANYQPLQERAQWDGLVRMYDEAGRTARARGRPAGVSRRAYHGR